MDSVDGGLGQTWHEELQGPEEESCLDKRGRWVVGWEKAGLGLQGSARYQRDSPRFRNVASMVLSSQGPFTNLYHEVGMELPVIARVCELREEFLSSE